MSDFEMQMWAFLAALAAVVIWAFLTPGGKHD